MVALGRLTAVTVLRSDQIAVRTQYGHSGSAKRAAWAKHSKDAHEHLVVAVGNKSCPLHLYWVLTTSSAMSLYVSLPSSLRSYCASTERYWLLPARTTSTRSSRCDYAARYTLMSMQWQSSDVCSRLTVPSHLCGCIGMASTLRGHFSTGTIGPRESVLCSQRSSEVIRVQSLWECVKYRDKGKNNRGPRRVWPFTNRCEFVRV